MANGRAGRNRTRSLTDEDFEELKGCIDLGFGFDHASVPAELCETLPALQVYCAVAQNFIHDSPTQAKAKSHTSSVNPNPNNPNNPTEPNPNPHCIQSNPNYGPMTTTTATVPLDNRFSQDRISNLSNCAACYLSPPLLLATAAAPSNHLCWAGEQSNDLEILRNVPDHQSHDHLINPAGSDLLSSSSSSSDQYNNSCTIRQAISDHHSDNVANRTTNYGHNPNTRKRVRVSWQDHHYGDYRSVIKSSSAGLERLMEEVISADNAGLSLDGDDYYYYNEVSISFF